jgi:hypothetical protein
VLSFCHLLLAIKRCSGTCGNNDPAPMLTITWDNGRNLDNAERIHVMNARKC